MSAPGLPARCQRLQLDEGGGSLRAGRSTRPPRSRRTTASRTDLLQAEADARQPRSITARPPMAPRPSHKTLDPFACGCPPRCDERPGRELATLQGVDAAANLVCLGPPGVGKTPRVVA